MKALEARPRYVQENWLVVITSSYGGVYEGNVTPASLYDDPRLNSFMMLYNSRFASKLLQRRARMNYNTNSIVLISSVPDKKRQQMPL